MSLENYWNCMRRAETHLVNAEKARFQTEAELQLAAGSAYAHMALAAAVAALAGAKDSEDADDRNSHA